MRESEDDDMADSVAPAARPKRSYRTYTGSRRARRRDDAVPAPGEPGGKGSPQAKDALVLQGLIRVAPGLDREQVMDLLGWEASRLDAALDVLKRLEAS